MHDLITQLPKRQVIRHPFLFTLEDGQSAMLYTADKAGVARAWLATSTTASQMLDPGLSCLWHIFCPYYRSGRLYLRAEAEIPGLVRTHALRTLLLFDGFDYSSAHCYGLDAGLGRGISATNHTYFDGGKGRGTNALYVEGTLVAGVAIGRLFLWDAPDLTIVRTTSAELDAERIIRPALPFPSLLLTAGCNPMLYRLDTQQLFQVVLQSKTVGSTGPVDIFLWQDKALVTCRGAEPRWSSYTLAPLETASEIPAKDTRLYSSYAALPERPRPCDLSTLPQRRYAGLGDLVAHRLHKGFLGKITKALGYPAPCASCRRRQSTLNRWFPFK